MGGKGPSGLFGRRAQSDIWEPEEDILLGFGKTSGWRRPTTSRPAIPATANWKTRWRRADGPHLRQPPKDRTASPTRWPRPATSARLRADGDERLRDRGGLTAGATPFGKMHGAGDALPMVGPEPEGRPDPRDGLRLAVDRTSRARAAMRSPPASRVPGRRTPTTWDMAYFDVLLGYDWELTKESGRRLGLDPEGPQARGPRARSVKPASATGRSS